MLCTNNGNWKWSCKINVHCRHQANDLCWSFVAVVVVIVVAIDGVFFVSFNFFVGFLTFGRMMQTERSHTIVQEVDEKNAQNRTFLFLSLALFFCSLPYSPSPLPASFSTFLYRFCFVVKEVESERCLCISCWIIPVLQFFSFYFCHTRPTTNGPNVYAIFDCDCV